MPGITASVNDIIENLTGFAKGIPTDALLAGAEIVLAVAKDNAPVKTGFLRDSGHIEVQGNTVDVVFDADYASFVEFGTRFMEAQPFLRPAIELTDTQVLEAVGARVEDFMVEELNR